MFEDNMKEFDSEELYARLKVETLTHNVKSNGIGILVLIAVLVGLAWII